MFAASGPEASLNEIARRAGVGPGTLYRHFPNRPALLSAVLGERIAALCARAEELSATEPPDAALAAWLHAFLVHARVNRGLVGAHLVDEQDGPGAEGAGDGPGDCHRLILEAASGLLTRAQTDGTARGDLAADDLVHLVIGIALSTTQSRDVEQPGRLLSLVLDAAYASAAPAKDR
ncbi:TetR/AcrR family transcriptional regulator [Streptomyces sp. NRRL B-1381]|uniref:TetR/AcrR family transcriptional regulator n=1 Tax=Streptomyces sp. NRRL B-1381 TaxID=1463829 RepID=UPI000A92CC4C|nr:TetR/AcrR family transcriptional regulator [Streptomyces sp. NRRL B-1381]